MGNLNALKRFGFLCVTMSVPQNCHVQVNNQAQNFETSVTEKTYLQAWIWLPGLSSCFPRHGGVQTQHLRPVAEWLLLWMLTKRVDETTSQWPAIRHLTWSFPRDVFTERELYIHKEWLDQPESPLLKFLHHTLYTDKLLISFPISVSKSFHKWFHQVQFRHKRRIHPS